MATQTFSNGEIVKVKFTDGTPDVYAKVTRVIEDGVDDTLYQVWETENEEEYVDGEAGWYSRYYAHELVKVDAPTAPDAVSAAQDTQAADGQAAVEHTLAYGDYVYNNEGERCKVFAIHGNRVNVEYEDGSMQSLSAIGLRLAKVATQAQAQHDDSERGDADDYSTATWMVVDYDTNEKIGTYDEMVADRNATIATQARELADVRAANAKLVAMLEEAHAAIKDATRLVDTGMIRSSSGEVRAILQEANSILRKVIKAN